MVQLLKKKKIWSVLLFGIWGLIWKRLIIKWSLHKITGVQEQRIATVLARLLIIIIHYNYQRNVSFIKVRNPLFFCLFPFNRLVMKHAKVTQGLINFFNSTNR